MRSGTHRRVAPGGALPASGVEGVVGRGWEGCPGEGRGVESRGDQKERAGIKTGMDKA